jgi:hypothetical protein
MNDTNQMPLASWHPRIPSVTYFGMDWDCETFNSALSGQIQNYWGNISVANTVAYILPTVQTGDLHAAVYDLTDSLLYVSFARSDNGTVGPKEAYVRQFTQLDATALFAEPPPVFALPLALAA